LAARPGRSRAPKGVECVDDHASEALSPALRCRHVVREPVPLPRKDAAHLAHDPAGLAAGPVRHRGQHHRRDPVRAA